MKVYSPSSTLSFQRCPYKWVVEHQGVRSKRIANPDLAAAVGVGISKGMELYFKEEGLDVAVEAGIAEAYALIQSRIVAGGFIIPACESTYTLMGKRIEKAVRGFHTRQPFPSDWHTFNPELVFPDHGNARADLLCMSDMGPCVVDFKSKVTAQDRIVDDFLFDAETSWQMYHYVWAAREMGIDVQSFAICLIVIEPLHIYLEQWVVDEDRLKQWYRDARYWWYHMEVIESDVAAYVYEAPRAADHRDKYGLCSLYNYCHGSPYVRETEYITLERSK